TMTTKSLSLLRCKERHCLMNLFKELHLEH
ncbi:hypothetical protein MP638_006683, partial [Amoeboaphelidium occidentale]